MFTPPPRIWSRDYHCFMNMLTAHNYTVTTNRMPLHHGRWLGTKLQGQAMPDWAVNSKQYSSICMSPVQATNESTNTPHTTLLHWTKPESPERMDKTNSRQRDKSFYRTQPSLRLAETTTVTGQTLLEVHLHFYRFWAAETINSEPKEVNDNYCMEMIVYIGFANISACCQQWYTAHTLQQRFHCSIANVEVFNYRKIFA